MIPFNPHTTEWITATGLQAFAVLTEMGHYCGYVALPEGVKPLDYTDRVFQNIEIHGGLTFSGKLSPDGPNVVGFDCAHVNDAPHPDSPRGQLDKVHGPLEAHAVFRDETYVRAECEKLAAKLVALQAELSRPSRTARAAAVLHFISGVSSAREALELYNTFDESEQPVVELLGEHQNIYYPYEDFSDADLFDGIESLAWSIDACREELEG